VILGGAKRKSAQNHRVKNHDAGNDHRDVHDCSVMNGDDL
jgi:hypothetical protein